MSEDNRQRFDDYLDRRRDDLGATIHDLWGSRDAGAWAADPHFYTRLAETADRLGQAMFAHDVLREALGVFPDDPRLTQLYSLSLVKCGFLSEARDRLSRLVSAGHEDEETLGILGRVSKEIWLASTGGDPSHPALRAARDMYLRAFRSSRGHYSGINAASLSLVLGETEAAVRLARMVVRICLEATRRGGGVDYWTMATLGEAQLVLGRQEDAARCYRRARSLAGRNFAELASSRRQVRLLARYAPVDEAVAAALRIPPVVAFTGHLLDAPGRRSPRFPAAAEPAVRGGIEAALEGMEAGIGYSSAACGADTLFLEALQAKGGETNVVMPFDRADFFASSVGYAGEEWVERVQKAIAGSTSVDLATRGGHGGDDLLFLYANSLIMGKALLRARLLETDAHLLAVWDGKDTRRTGGTSQFIDSWTRTGRALTVIDSRTGQQVQPRQQRAAVRPARAARSLPGAPGRRAPPVVRRGIVAMLFADLVGYSRLGEEQFPRYIESFLGAAADRLRDRGCRPVFRNTWGDAILLVFRDLRGAAEYALALRDMVRTTDWQERGLPSDLAIRIGLHAGPVYYAREPVAGRLNFFGTHVNQAARIEPITSPGNVYASEQFAALLAGEPREGLDCRYVGVIVLPKEFGSFPIYHLRRGTDTG
jgi:class 3 adenylate cyclase